MTSSTSSSKAPSAGLVAASLALSLGAWFGWFQIFGQPPAPGGLSPAAAVMEDDLARLGRDVVFIGNSGAHRAIDGQNCFVADECSEGSERIKSE